MTTLGYSLRPRSIGLGALIAVCLYISGLLVILTPLPILYVSATYGRKNGVLTAVASFLLVAVLYTVIFSLNSAAGGINAMSVPLPGLGLISHFSSRAVQLFGGGYFLFFVVVALVLGEAVRSHWGLVKGGASALFAGLASAVVLAIVLQLSGAAQLISGIRAYLDFVVSEIVRIQQAADVTNAQIALLSEHGPEVASFVLNIIPSIVFVFALIAVVVNLLFSRRFVRMPHLFAGHAWDVAAFRISDAFIWAVIGSAFAFFAGRYLAHARWLEMAGINALISMGAVYFFQGLAVLTYFLRRIKMPLIRIAAYIFIILFFQTIGVLIVGIGLADVWVDFRRRSQKGRSHASNIDG